MDIWPTINLVVACICAFACGYNVKARDYGWAMTDAILALSNFIIAFI